MKRILFVLCVFSSACSVQLPALRGGFGVYDDLDPSLIEKVDAPIVILNEELYVGHDAAMGARTTYEYFRRTLISKEAGLDYAIAHVPLPAPWEGQLGLLQAATRLPNGEVIPVDPKDMLDHEVFRAGGMARGQYVRSFAFPRATVGAILDLHFVLIEAGYVANLRFALDGPFPVRSAKFVFRAYSDIELSVQTQGFKQEAKSVAPHVVCTFELTEPHLGPPEVVAPPRENEWVPQVRIVRKNKAWDEIGDLMWDPFNSDSDTELADIGVRNLSPNERVMRIWQFVQEELEPRQGVISSRDEWTVNRIVRNRRGNVRERALVLLAMLRAAGLNTKVVLVPPASMAELNATFVQRSLAAEADLLAWVEIDGKSIVLDPYCEGCTAGELAPEHHDRKALIVGPVKSNYTHSVALETLRAAPGWRRESKTELQLELGKDGVIVRTGRWELAGGSSAHLRHVIGRYGADDAEELLRERLGLAEEGGTVRYENPKPSTVPFIVHVENIELDDATYTEAPGRVTVSAEMLWSRTGMLSFGREREVDLYLGTVAPWSATFTIAQVGGCTWAEPPPLVELSHEFAKYRQEVSRDGPNLKLAESMAFLATRVPAARIGELRDFIAEVSRARSRPLVCGGRSE